MQPLQLSKVFWCAKCSGSKTCQHYSGPGKIYVLYRKVRTDAVPLIGGAGVTIDTVEEKLRYSDGIIIGSWLKEGHWGAGDVCEAYVKEFMDKVRKIRKTQI